MTVSENSTAFGDEHNVILIPKQITHDGVPYTVVSIGRNAFYFNGLANNNDTNQWRARKIEFPRDSEVTSFQERAFQNTLIQELQIPPKLTDLHPLTFRHTSKLIAVTAPGNPNFVVDNGVLYNKSRTALLFVPRNIAQTAFRIPPNVTSIGPYAFGDCRSIESVQFAGPVAVLGAGAFSGTSLKSFEFPASVLEAGEDLFGGCTALARVTFAAGTRLKRIPKAAFRGTAIQEITIPALVEMIESQAFATTQSLVEVKFEGGSECKYIFRDVFWQSTIRALAIPAKLELLLGNFFRCPYLEVFNIDKNNRNFTWQNGILFNGAKTEIFFVAREIVGRFEMPNTVEAIHANAFADCVKITSVTFGEASALRRIEARAFGGSGLTEIRIPKRVIVIEENAFVDCEQLKHVDFTPDSELTRIGSEAFRRSGLEEFNGPPKLASLERGVFAYAYSLRNVVLPPGVVLIRPGTFTECGKLEMVTSRLGSGEIIVQGRGFSSRFDRAHFVHTHDVKVIWLEGDQLWPRRVVPPPPGPLPGPGPFPPVPGADVVYEKGKPHGTSPGDFVLDGSHRRKIEGTEVRSPMGVGYQARHITEGVGISWVKEFNAASNVEAEKLIKQGEFFSKIAHPAVLGVIGYVLPGDGVPAKLVTEYMPGGTLDALIKNPAKYAALSTTKKVKIAVGIAVAMRYIHRCGVFHRDLKPANVLLDANDEVRVGDFRTARVADVVGMSITGGLGNAHYYAAPEIGGEDQTRYGPKVDVFAYAMMLWEIMTGRSVVTGYKGGKDIGFIAHHRRIAAGERPSTDDLGGDSGLLDACWETDPDDRMSFEDILDFLAGNSYGILPDVNGNEVARYVSQLEDFEAEYPAESMTDPEE